MGAEVWRPAGDADNSHFRALTGLRVADKKSVGASVDAGDDCLARPFPIGGRVAQMGNVLMGTQRMRFGNTRHLNVCHYLLLSPMPSSDFSPSGTLTVTPRQPVCAKCPAECRCERMAQNPAHMFCAASRP